MSKRQGFASMDPARQRKIASKGGKAAHAKGRGHEWTVEEARAAGRKGGAVGRRKAEIAKGNVELDLTGQPLDVDASE